MKRLARIAIVALPLLTLATAPAYAEVKTRDRTTVKLNLGRFLNMFLGKAAKDGVEGLTAVKGNRKITLNDASGRIIDLTEQKVYDLDVKKKTYTVTTFEELRRQMREAQERASKAATDEQPAKKDEPQKPTKEYEIDFDVKDTGQKKAIAGYDTHETIVTITVREKGKTLEESGGLVMTNDMWLGPKIPALKELYDFDIKYAKQLEGGQETPELSAEQMAALMGQFPLIAKASARMAKDGDKLSGTPLDTTTTLESVMSKDDLTNAQANSSSQKGGGGLSGMLAKKIIKTEPPKARSTFMTSHHEVLEVTPSATDADVAIPAGFKETTKK
jgi:hypothetical protein